MLSFLLNFAILKSPSLLQLMLPSSAAGIVPALTQEGLEGGGAVGVEVEFLGGLSRYVHVGWKKKMEKKYTLNSTSR